MIIRPAEPATDELPPPAAVRPDLTPAPPEDFTGRSAELAELAAKAGSGAAVIGIQGMAGVGKTALALKLAEALAPRFPDAQLWVDLHGSDPARNAGPAAALQTLLRPFFPASILPAGADELAALLQKTLAGRRALLVADDARGADDLARLVPPAGSLLIATSREAPALPGAHAKYLSPLRPPDAAALIDRLAPGLGERAAEAARACGCLPFVLRLAGWALEHRLDLDSAEFARQLAAARGGGTLADAALALAAELLSEGAREMWGALSTLPADFDLGAAAALGGVPDQPARAALVELARAGLVVGAGGPRRLRLHELARAWADSRRTDADRAAGRLRHAVWALSALRRAEKLCTGDIPAVGEGLALLDAEWEHISAAQSWAAAEAAGDQTLGHLVCDFPTAGAQCLALRRSPHERAGWIEAALAAARRLGLRATEPAQLFGLGTLHAETGDLPRAAACFEQCLAAAGRLADRRGECAALGSLAAVLWDQGRREEAAASWKRQLELARALKDRRAETGALGRLALAATAAGEGRGARRFAEQHLAAVRETSDRAAELAALGGLGAACAADGDAARAAECFERQAALAGELGDERAEGAALANLSAVAARLGEPRRAIAWHERLLAHARKSGDRAGELAAAGGLAAACHELGEHRRTVEYSQLQAGIARALGDGRAECAALGNAAAAWRAAGEHRAALEAGERHLALARELSDRRAEAAALAGLGQSLAALGDPGRAAERYEAHRSVLRSTGGAQPAPALLGSLGTAYFQTGENARAAKCFEEQLAAARAAGERRSEGNALYNLGLALDRLGQRAGAVEKLEAALKVYKSARDPSARLAAEQLERWKDQDGGRDATADGRR